MYGLVSNLGGGHFHYMDYRRMGPMDSHFGHQSLLKRIIFFKKSAPIDGLFQELCFIKPNFDPKLLQSTKFLREFCKN